ncbi:DNA polymerase III subunit delta [Alkalihalophilus lindianensis]|uniref:DNA polymerase III subunit delta n=1 Tax=Alkalihalophilus lindianensis TaxID=1630542 RepID=A0ABU3X592_9BACI|nr:DNA polymerase III subunit delta [Alkalihalophilus lindianensis]MDV2683061.1 DNA polymerase III subunit delta [Alkalihalophilus lindianensis]
MNYLQAKKELKQGKVSPVYFIYGTQAFLIEDFTQHLLNQVIGQDGSDMNVITYTFSETPIELAVQEAETMPFLGTNKVVIVKDFHAVTSQKTDSKIEHDLDVLTQYIENPSPESTLVLVAPYEKLDERKRVTKRLKKEATVIEAMPFDDRMMKQWIEEQATTKGIQITKEASERLVERLGFDLLMLAGELEKMALYVGEEEITVDVVELLVARTLEQDVFALIDFAVKKRLDEALVIYHDLLKQKEDPLKLLALLARQFRIYYQVKGLSKQAYSQKQIATQLKLHPYVVKLASAKVNQFNERTLLTFLEACADTDYAIKSGKIDKVLALELLLMKMTQKTETK